MGHEELKDYLRTIEPGRIARTGDLERLLAEVWEDLGGDDGGMAGCKLISRMERVEWHPPTLIFTIERHGGTAFGSTRAELQRWSVDLDRMMATCERAGHRQLSPTARRVDVGPIAAEMPGWSSEASQTPGSAGSATVESGSRWAGSSLSGRGTSRQSRAAGSG